jgi:ATP-dependent Clp protease ATP-binding subunit ClpC
MRVWTSFSKVSIANFGFAAIQVIIKDMRLGFTEALSAALVHADEEARRHGQEFVGTEHLLLGILTAKTGEAFRALQAETEIEQLLPHLDRALPKSSKPARVTGRLPLSPKAQRIVNTAASEAQAAAQTAVSTRFLLLALLDEAESTVGKIIADSGADLDELRSLLSRPNSSHEE